MLLRHFGIVPEKSDSIKENRNYLDDLLKEGLKWYLIRRTVHLETKAPCECHEAFSETLDCIKEHNPKLYKSIIHAKKSLKALLTNSAIHENEKEEIEIILKRINSDYPKHCDQLENFRSNEDISKVEDYENEEDGFSAYWIDSRLRTDLQCREKTVSLLFNYIEQFRIKISERNYAFPRDYYQTDTFKLIAEILNLRFPIAKYDHKIMKGHQDYYLYNLY